MANKTSQHILPTASNLLGFCLIVITSLHISSATVNSILDEFTSIVALLLCLSVILSFASIKSENKKWTHRLELIAEILFGTAITGIGIIVLVLLKKFWLQ
ncbi:MULTISPECIES: hypothetical protein [unclassified Kaistella]|uniref:hypothetical protein n=1 Tax=unclassified Kaistella TaxID=2762626 RepID=UPI002736A0E3|nr:MULTISPECIES: hypothetical protein [unclassified Kaistella]MCZ2083924.1 hypothetical protein [Flavobacteriales bacterium]MDP2454533.1 hypothetical protein [Kaistella sp. SH11-4b]MDP2457271.1 hypothetical protein [Kaistella sp. SH40-3]MDP2460031.1 hypothetical protein [Kaistella sp. SH19-2b]